MQITGKIISDAVVKTNGDGSKVVHFLLYIDVPDSVNEDETGFEIGTIHKCSYWKLSALPSLTQNTKVEVTGYMAVSNGEHGEDEEKGGLIMMVNLVLFYLVY
jgi:hypothetical protein